MANTVFLAFFATIFGCRKIQQYWARSSKGSRDFHLGLFLYIKTSPGPNKESRKGFQHV
jgi:hypothetical protein